MPLDLLGSTSYGGGGTQNVATQISGLQGVGGGSGGLDLMKLLKGLKKLRGGDAQGQARMLQAAPPPVTGPYAQGPSERYETHLTPQGTFYRTYVSGPRQGMSEWGAGAERFGHFQGTPIKTG